MQPVTRPICSENDLEMRLSEPAPAVLAALRELDSDLLVLGVGGKMGPTLARMAARALAQLNSPYVVYGVSRFSQPGLRDKLEEWGVRTLVCDLLDRRAVAALPDSQALILMAGHKFGTTENAALTWAVNTCIPALVAERFSAARLPAARMVAFSTGNVYSPGPVAGGGSQEQDPLAPQGEYAQSCAGRERILAYFSQQHGLRCAIMRLNYAVELRYGVLVDIARRVQAQQPVNLATGVVNVIWQGDANARALALLAHCASPPFVLNVTGPETVSVRRAAERFGQLLGVPVTLAGEEAPTALLSNAARAHGLFGYPQVSLEQMMLWIADWVRRAGADPGANTRAFLDKPTHFETRDGRY